MSFKTANISPDSIIVNRRSREDASDGIDQYDTVKALADESIGKHSSTLTGKVIVHVSPVVYIDATVEDDGSYTFTIAKFGQFNYKLKIWIGDTLIYNINGNNDTTWDTGKTVTSTSSNKITKDVWLTFACSEFPNNANAVDSYYNGNVLGTADHYCYMQNYRAHEGDDAVVKGGEIHENQAFSVYAVPVRIFKAPSLKSDCSISFSTNSSGITGVSGTVQLSSLGSNSIGSYYSGGTEHQAKYTFYYNVKKGDTTVVSGTSLISVTDTNSHTFSKNSAITDPGTYTATLYAKYKDISMWWYGYVRDVTKNNIDTDIYTIAEADVDINKPTASLLGASCCNIYSKVSWTGGSGTYSNLKYYVKVNTSKNSNSGTESNKTSNGDEVTISSLAAGTTYYGFYKVSGSAAYGNYQALNPESVKTKNPKVVATDIGSDYITIQISDDTSQYTGSNYCYKLSTATTWTDITTNTATISGLTVGTEYTIQAKLGKSTNPTSAADPNDATASTTVKTLALAVVKSTNIVASGTTIRVTLNVTMNDATSVSGTAAIGSATKSFSANSNGDKYVVFTGLQNGKSYTVTFSGFKSTMSSGDINITNPGQQSATTYFLTCTKPTESANTLGNNWANIIMNWTSGVTVQPSLSPSGGTHTADGYIAKYTGLTPNTDYTFSAYIINVYAYKDDGTGDQSTVNDATCSCNFKTIFINAVASVALIATGKTIRAAVNITFNDANSVSGQIAIGNQTRTFSNTNKTTMYAVFDGLSNGETYTVKSSNFTSTIPENGTDKSYAMVTPTDQSVTTYKISYSIATTPTTPSSHTDLKTKENTVRNLKVATGANKELSNISYSLNPTKTPTATSNATTKEYTLRYTGLSHNTTYTFTARVANAKSYTSSTTMSSTAPTQTNTYDAELSTSFTTGIPAVLSTPPVAATGKTVTVYSSTTFNNSETLDYTFECTNPTASKSYEDKSADTSNTFSGLGFGTEHYVKVSAVDNEGNIIAAKDRYVKTYGMSVECNSPTIRSIYNCKFSYIRGGYKNTASEDYSPFSNLPSVVYWLTPYENAGAHTGVSASDVQASGTSDVIKYEKVLKESTTYTFHSMFNGIDDTEATQSTTTATAAKDFDIKIDATGTTADFKVTYTPAKHSNGTLLPNNKIFIEILLSYASREIHSAVDTSNKTYTLEHTADSSSAVTLLHNTSSGLPTSTTYNLTYKVYDSEDCYSTGYGNTYSGSSSDKPEFITYKTSNGYTGASTVLRTYDTRIYSTEYSTRSLLTSYQCTNGFNYYTSYNAHVLSAHTDKVRYELYTLEKTNTGDIIGTLVNSGYSTSGVNDGTSGNGAKFKDIMLKHNTPMLFRTYIVRSDNSELKDRNGRIDTARDFYFCTHRLDFYLKKSIFHTHVITQYIQGVYVDKNVEDDDNVVYSDGDCYDYNKDDISSVNTYISFISGNSVVEEKNSIITNIYGASNGDASTREIDNNVTPRRITFRDLTDAIRYTTKLSYSDGYNTVSRTYDNMCTLPITALIANKQKDEFEDYIPYISVNGVYKKAIPYVCYRNTNGVLEWKEARCTKEPEGVIKEYDYKYD